MVKTINTTLLIAILLFLSAFFVANVNFLSGFYVKVSCAPGDINHDGDIATGDDASALKYLIETSGYTSCGDLNEDGKVDSADKSIFLSIKTREDTERQKDGRYCFNECPAEGEKACTAQDYTLNGKVIQRNGNLFKTCGNYDTDPCLEWNPDSSACPQGERCRPKNPGSDVCVSANLAEENVLVNQY